MENRIQLNNGLLIPQLGYGTIGQTSELITDNVAFALHHGYELIDTANRYGNEAEVGQGLKRPVKIWQERLRLFLNTPMNYRWIRWDTLSGEAVPAAE